MSKKKKKLLFTIFIISLVILDIILFCFIYVKDTKKVKKYENEYLEFEYTGDYTLKEDSHKISISKQNKSGQIDIVISELSQDIIERDEDIIINEVNNDFENNNSSFTLSYNNEFKVNNYIVKNFLYIDENNNKQIDLNYIIDNDKLILISYTNVDKYFDLYISNVIDILESINIK